jgi:hypothetical protein
VLRVQGSRFRVRLVTDAVMDSLASRLVSHLGRSA